MAGSHTRKDAGKKIEYPTNHVVGVVDTPGQLESLLTTLTSSGFLESEVSAGSGEARARALDASTGRTGLAHLAIRIAEHFGVRDEEMEVKDRYEQALRDGHFVVSVLAPTEERKVLAGRLMREHGGRFVNFLGRFVIEPLRR